MRAAGRRPEVHYAKSGDLSIAYTAFGGGADLVIAPGFERPTPGATR